MEHAEWAFMNRPQSRWRKANHCCAGWARLFRREVYVWRCTPSNAADGSPLLSHLADEARLLLFSLEAGSQLGEGWRSIQSMAKQTQTATQKATRQRTERDKQST